MKPATAALTTYLLNNDEVMIADLYTIGIVSGEFYRFCEYDLDLTGLPKVNFPGSPLNYAASGTVDFVRGPGFGRTKTTQKVGVEADTVEISVFPRPGIDALGTNTWQQAANIGIFDGATWEIDRFYIPIGGDGVKGPLDTSLGAIVWFYGRTSTPVDASRSEVKFSIKDLRNLLQQQQMPRRLFQTGCTHIFGDAMCGFNRTTGVAADGTPSGIGAAAVLSGGSPASTKSVITTAGYPVGTGIAPYYIQGTIIGTSGPNIGVQRTISNVIDESGYYAIVVTRPFPYTPVVLDGFTILPGCDHTSATCNVFQNFLRYGGFDYIPPPEIAL